MADKIQSFQLQSTSELDDLAKQLRALVTNGLLPDALINDMMVITDEILSNLLKYGGGSQLELILYRRDDELELHCIDNGSPFNPLLAERPNLDLPMELRETGGLGIELVMAMTNNQTYRRENEHNYLTLTLPIPSQP